MTLTLHSLSKRSVAELAGQYKISQDSASLSLGLTVADALEAEASEPVVLGESPQTSGKGLYSGGSKAGWRKFLRGTRRFLNKVNNIGKTITPLLANTPYGPVAQGAQALLGTATDLANQNQIGSGMRGRGLLRA